MVTVVSQALRDEIVGRGVDADKVLVNPNGVDADMYSPGVDGQPVRERFGLEAKLVIGFIGTFGPWHGAEVLAEAFGRLLHDRPEDRDAMRLLLVGDGDKMHEVRDRIAAHGVEEQVILTGAVPQAEGPAYLAAMDILVSPHVPNPDGTPFFNSPTKIFEYMAMGRCVVASDLGQPSELLEDERTALLVPASDPTTLASALARLAGDPDLRQRLGDAARREVVARYTWSRHTERIVQALAARCGGSE
jgi:glycosyltransferase involved in cell wall biosynthesis